MPKAEGGGEGWDKKKKWKKCFNINDHGSSKLETLYLAAKKSLNIPNCVSLTDKLIPKHSCWPVSMPQNI